MVWSIRSKGKGWQGGPAGQGAAVGEGLAGVGMARPRAVGTGGRQRETGSAGRFLSTGARKHHINRVDKGVSNSSVSISPL